MNWTAKYYNVLWVFLAFAVAVFWLFADATYQVPQESFVGVSTQLKHGAVESLDRNGRLKTLVHYDSGKKQGTSYLYYPDGKVQLEMPYKNNMRHGVSKKYFKDGSLYAATPYVNDKLEGIRETFFRSGKTKGLIPYHNSWPGKGLREFFKDGGERELDQTLEFRQVGDLFFISTNEPCRKRIFYVGQLERQQYLNKKGNVWVVGMQGDEAVIDLSETQGIATLKGQEVICLCTTKQGHPLVLSRKI